MSYLCLFICLIVLSPLTAFGQPSFPNNPAEGARLFSEKGCFRCHAILGEGGHVGHDLGRVDIGGSQLAIAGDLLNHAPTMNAKMAEMKVIWPRLTGAEVESLVAYLYYVHYFDQAGNTVRGEKLFSGRGCHSCHSSTGKNASAPPLAAFPRDLSPIFLAKALWNHGPSMKAAMAQRGISWPKFEGTEIMDLVAYLKGAARGEAVSYHAPGNPNEGIKVFQNKGCVRCHGSEAGAARIDLSERSRGLKKSLTQVVARMWNHAPDIFGRMQEVRMAVPRFTEKEIADLVASLYFLNYFDPPPDSAAGQKLFSQKQCSVCHSAGGGAQGVGPDLSVTRKASSVMEMVASIWNHAPFMQSLMKEKNIPWPKFEENELNYLLGYLQYVRSSTPPAKP
ncbi:MAG: c-type cytochrome [Deltaproteobacteria bacterium]|nr:c-type cytochrome [Deltaproteobacteria bacterium]